MDFYFSELNLSSDKLKCCKCECYLSIFPIYTCPSTYKNICGRCIQGSPKIPRRNEAYEAVSQFINFPCRYKTNGCCEEILPKNMPRHEALCPYKILKCPTFNATRCTWIGPSPQILKHFQDKHRNLVLSQEFQVDLSKSYDQRHFLGYEDQLFIVSRKFDLDKNLLYFSISHLNDKNYNYKIIFKNDKREFSVKTQTTDSKNLNYVKIPLDLLKSESGDPPTVLGKIVFEKSLDQDEKESIKPDMLSITKCSMCSSYSIPPIFWCISDSSIICSECHSSHIRQCETCSNDENIDTKSRNVNLDKLVISLLNYPCKYRNNRCPFISKLDQVKKHHRFCSYRDYACPVKDFVKCDVVCCGSANDVTSHVLRDHSDIVTDVRKFLFHDYNIERKREHPDNTSPRLIKSNSFCSTIQCKIIKFYNHLFRLNFTRIDNKFCWEMQLIGYFPKGFIYEIEIVNASTNRILSKKQLCSLVMEKSELFLDEEYFCTFEKSQVENFISREQLMFQVNIFRKPENIQNDLY